MAYAYSKPADGKRRPAFKDTLAKLIEYEQAQNVAELLDERELDKIGDTVKSEYDIDKRSRSDWEATAEKAMNVALQVRQPKNYPFEGAANIKYPLVTVAALQFGARAYPAIVDGNRIVKGQVMGRDDGQPAPPEEQQALQADMQAAQQEGQPLQLPPEVTQLPNKLWLSPDGKLWQIPPGAKKAKAERVSEHMSYQLMNEMEEWEEDTDVLLHHLPIVGCAFRKVWRSEELGRNKAEMVPAVHLVVNNKVRSLDEAPRVTHEVFLYPQEIEERMLSGTFVTCELPESTEDNADGDEDAPHTFLEQHRYLDLDGDGYREPYIVTIHKETCKVVRIVANFTMERVKYDDKRILRIPKEQYFVKYSFIPDPKGGFYDIGFGALLESLSETIDTTINQMLDAGHLQNAGGGFIGSGVRLKKNQIRVSPGKYEFVESSGSIRDNIYNHEHGGPSPVLFNLLGMMIEAARDITAVKDILTGDGGTKSPQTATTTLALIEQGLKVFTAIYKRVYRALKDEFKLLFELNARHLTDQEYYTYLDQQQVVAKSDYDIKSMDVCPVADPKMVTDMQRASRANMLLQLAETATGQANLDGREILRRVLDAMGEPEIDKLMPQKQGPSKAEQLMEADAEAEVRKKNAGAAKDEVTAAQTALEVEQAQNGDPGAERLEAAKVQAAEHAASVKMATAEHGAQLSTSVAEHNAAMDVEEKEREAAHKERLRAIKLQEAEDKAKAAKAAARKPEKANA